jgi:outer membrane lipoprotein SlyB
MKQKILSLVFGAVVAVTGVSCGPNAQTGAVLGGLGGAAVGGIIGNQSGRGLEGAAIGAGAGALGGALIGDSQDQRNAQAREDYYREQQYRRDPGPPPGYRY